MGAQLPDAEAGGATATLAVAPTIAEPTARRRRGWTRNLDVIIPRVLVGLLLFLCFIWPLFGTVPPPTGGNILDANLPSFSEGHLLGTDQVGNDLWSRLLYGGRNSLEIAFAVNVIGLGRSARSSRRCTASPISVAASPTAPGSTPRRSRSPATRSA